MVEGMLMGTVTSRLSMVTESVVQSSAGTAGLTK